MDRMQIKAGSLIRKTYIDLVRHFIAIRDSEGAYVLCLDLDLGGTTTVGIPAEGSIATLEILA